MKAFHTIYGRPQFDITEKEYHRFCQIQQIESLKFKTKIHNFLGLSYGRNLKSLLKILLIKRNKDTIIHMTTILRHRGKNAKNSFLGTSSLIQIILTL